MGLEFKQIDVSFIYGYVNYNLRESAELPPRDNNGFKEMWAPIYNLNRSDDDYRIQDLTKSKHVMKDVGIYITSTQSKDKPLEAKLSASILRKIYNPKEKTKRSKGGPGSVTIKISVASDGNFTIDTIFDILKLIPRTSSTLDLPKEIEFKDPVLNSQKKEFLTNFSPIFRLFYELLRENQECWNELHKPDNKNCENPCGNCVEYHPFYDEDTKIDPQIPYIFVEGYLPKDAYYKGFVDKRCDHSDYTNEIGCLLGRWLSSANTDQLNTDYYCYYKDNDEIIAKKGNAFISRYRDKKSFIVFSSLLTLILKCKHSDKNTANKDKDEAADSAVDLTTNSVSSYLAFSRTRLHHALWLNKQLDELVNKVDDKEKTSQLLEVKKDLNKLKGKVAKSMNNPMSYMWDSVLGQEIPSLRINRNVEKLENATITKLNLINELIADKIKDSQISVFSDLLTEQKNKFIN